MNECTEGPKTRSQRRLRCWAGLLATGLMGGTVVLGTAWATLDRGNRTPEPRLIPLSVSVTKARQQNRYSAHRLFIGRVEPSRSGDLGFELAGRLDRVLADEGARVTTGQVLARLDVERLTARRAELEADLARTQAELALARATLKRVEDLIKAKHASAQELDEAREGHRALRAAVDLARSRIRSVDVDLEKSALTAPYDAVVTRRLADEGIVLSAGQPVLELQEWRSPEARVGVAGRALQSVRPGDQYTLRIDSREITASVKAVLPVRRATTRTVDVVLALDVEPSLVRAGDLVELRLPYEIPETGFWVPLSALTEARRGLWAAYVAEPTEAMAGRPHHRIRQRLVEVIEQATDRAFVRGTLRDGDLLVTEGLHRVVPGQAVQIAVMEDPS